MICRIGVIGGLYIVVVIVVVIVVIHIYICLGQAEMKGWREGGGI